MKKWFALYTKPRREFKAFEQLKEISVTAYLPTITTTKQWHDRKKKITEPLFKSYIFIHANDSERNNAITRDAIIKVIFFNGKPAVIPEFEMERLKKLLETPEKLEVFNGIAKGVLVKIESGPFVGIEGIVSSIGKGESTLSVCIEMLNRTITATIPSSTKIKKIN